MRLPLQTLHAFRAAARLQNLRAAADELHLTHSAVSQQIRTLEDQLGFAVFARVGRRIVLNAAGQALFAHVDAALGQLELGVQAAAAAATGHEQRVRLTVVPSFAQRWLMPRIARWRTLHPDIAIEIHASQQVMDLQREGFHAAVRQGRGDWDPLVAEPLTDSPMVVVGSPVAAQRLAGQEAQAFVHEPLLGEPGPWEQWFAAAGLPRQRIKPVAIFNDLGLMLQAAEQNLGIALARELLAADALRDGRLLRLHPLALRAAGNDRYFLVYPPALRDWPPLAALRVWLKDELRRGRRHLRSG
ncbi:LysR substrate-binding domain-containing protein [Caldimonas brevitalea]|uniref:LysR family transcriptional regulator n=1 Tax=Caldimonas brevitalea TaxID=413882 RepID=A0A0G3BQ60_9BURK|nr:LysR substrate-binding domain-containing protein [Caldimonas brevitalea]AKJ28695.1 LysR family transcriptional regulator [Caldimonas brevitalea]